LQSYSSSVENKKSNPNTQLASKSYHLWGTSPGVQGHGLYHSDSIGSISFFEE